MPSRSEKVAAFRALHQSGCFIMPNVWEAGGARMMQALGFKAIATTSSGYAWTINRKDGARNVSRDETLAHSRLLVEATDLPVNGDFEDCYADDPAGVAETVRLAAEAGLAGVSIEDLWPDGPEVARSFEDALARVEVAVDAARTHDIVLTARADGMIKGAYDLDEAIRRLLAFEAAGAEVLYAPMIQSLDDLRRVCGSVSGPVNHLVGPGLKGTDFDAIAATGARRLSLGGTLARAAHYALRGIAEEVAAGDFSTLYAAGGWDGLVAPSTKTE